MRREEIELLAPAGSYGGSLRQRSVQVQMRFMVGEQPLARGPMRRISERKSFCVPLILLISMAGNFI